MKQKSWGVLGVAMVAMLFAGLVSAGDATWVAKDGETVELHAHAEAMFISDEGGETFDLAELRDGETRTFGDGDKQVTVTRAGDIVTIERDDTDEKSKLEILCNTGSDSCKVVTFDDDPEKVMIMVQKTRECVNGVGDCNDVDIAIGGLGDFGGGAHHAIIRTVKCDDAGECEELEEIVGGPEVIAIGEGGPHRKMMIVHADEHGDQVLLRCPEGDSRIHVGQEEADDTFLCPKHSVPMVKAEQNHFIKKIRVEEKP
jgi:hypothetical protein